jgi:hypothetical protein
MGATPTKPGGVLGDIPLKRVDSSRTGLNLPMNVLRDNPTLRLHLENRRVTDLFHKSGSKLEVVNKAILEELEESTPAKWPSTNIQYAQVLALNTIPVNSSVIIAGTLDLTDTQLIIEPTVSTLYIIAERVICGPNASITWRKPGGSTPDRANDPDLNGRGFPGVQTKPNSRDGLDGEDGRSGGPGIDGARGRNAPNLEMWIKAMDAMPDLDLTGEGHPEARPAWRHWRRRGDGQVGRRYWFFGWHCSEDPGDGGDGETAVRAVAEAAAATAAMGAASRSACWRHPGKHGDQPAIQAQERGEDPGLGGPGGAGGSGGAGGISGAGETCHDAENGRQGAQGQPGPPDRSG